MLGFFCLKKKWLRKDSFQYLQISDGRKLIRWSHFSVVPSDRRGGGQEPLETQDTPLKYKDQLFYLEGMVLGTCSTCPCFEHRVGLDNLSDMV